MLGTEISALRRLHGMLEHDQLHSRAEFRDMMIAAFTHGRLELRELSDDLGFSFSTVFRWLEGRSAPHPSIWPRIVDWVMAALTRKIQTTEHEMEEAEVV
jgi:transcriptional regulator with XRE-family HTH domain